MFLYKGLTLSYPIGRQCPVGGILEKVIPNYSSSTGYLGEGAGRYFGSSQHHCAVLIFLVSCLHLFFSFWNLQHYEGTRKVLRVV